MGIDGLDLLDGAAREQVLRDRDCDFVADLEAGLDQPVLALLNRPARRVLDRDDPVVRIAALDLGHHVGVSRSRDVLGGAPKALQAGLVAECGARTQEGNPRRAGNISRGGQDLAVDRTQVVRPHPTVGKLLGAPEDFGLTGRRKGDRGLAACFPHEAASIARNVGTLDEELDNLPVEIVQPPSEGVEAARMFRALRHVTDDSGPAGRAASLTRSRIGSVERIPRSARQA
jgi:hypothetical protein